MDGTSGNGRRSVCSDLTIPEVIAQPQTQAMDMIREGTRFSS